MAERDAFVEYETFAVPAAVCLGHLFEGFKDAALEVVDFGEALREQIGTCLLATDPAGAEHGDLAVRGRIELLRNEILELSEAGNAGIDGAGKAADRDFESVAGVDHQRVRRRN